MIERFFRTAKEEVFWQHVMSDPDEAFRRFAEWIDFYHEGRPRMPGRAGIEDSDQAHSALGYLSSSEFRRKQAA